MRSRRERVVVEPEITAQLWRDDTWCAGQEIRAIARRSGLLLWMCESSVNGLPCDCPPKGVQHLSDDVVRSFSEVEPGEPQDSPAGRDQFVLLGAVSLEPMGRVVPRPAVDLDRQKFSNKGDVDGRSTVHRIPVVVDPPSPNPGGFEQADEFSLAGSSGPICRGGSNSPARSEPRLPRLR